MANFISIMALPGCQAGTRFARDAEGRYRSEDGTIWFEPAVVEQDSTRFVKDALPEFPNQGEAYYYLDESGEVQSTKLTGSDADASRLTIGNFFTSLEAIAPVQEKVRALFKPSGVKAYTKDDVAAALDAAGRSNVVIP